MPNEQLSMAEWLQQRQSREANQRQMEQYLSFLNSRAAPPKIPPLGVPTSPTYGGVYPSIAPPTTAGSRPEFKLSPPVKTVGTSSHLPPPGQRLPTGIGTKPTSTNRTSNAIDVLRKALEGNWIAQGMAPYTPPVGTSHMPPGGYPRAGSSGQMPNYAIPNEKMTANTRPGQIGTPNQTIINLEKARAEIEARPHGQSLGQTSLDLDPNLRGGGNPDILAALEAELRGLAGQEDIPGQWISPYSQEYLNQLGNRLGQAGSEAQQQFQGAIGDVVANYGQADATRNQYNTALANELAANGQNIGINTGASTQGQQAATDANYLNQVSAANQATDTSFMTKLGEMANFYGGNLGAQAREGLLTPKQWVGPQSGISGGEQLLADFLGNKYNRELNRQDAETQFERDLALAALKGSGSGSDQVMIDPETGKPYPDITETADVTKTVKNPEFLQALNNSGLSAREMDLVNQYYDEAGGDVAGALATARKAMSNPDYAPTYPNRPEIYGARAGAPMPKSGLIPRGASGPAGALDLSEPYNAQKLVDMQRWQAVIEFLTKYSPTRNPVTLSQDITNKSSTKYGPNT